VKLTHNGPDRILSIDAQDGGRKYIESYLDVSLASQVTGRQVFNRAVEAMGLPTGTIQLDDSIRFPAGFVFSGSPTEVLDRLASMSDADWYIRDGVLQFIRRGSTTGERSLLLSATSGNLIGSPKPTDEGVEVVGLLDPSMRPGRKFRIESENVNGDYVATNVEFLGDSGWDNSFYVTVKGKPL
jgi:hypothetical protein